MLNIHVDGKVRLIILVIVLLIVSVICLIFNKKLNDDYTEEVEEVDENDVVDVAIETTEHETANIENNETEELLVQSPLVVSKDWSDEDAYLLAKIAMAEAEGEDITGKALVICVILNRLNSDKYPDTIHDVIFQNNGKVYQFSPVIPGGRWYSVEPNDECYKAVEMVQAGWDESNGALFFTSQKEASTWHSRNLEFLFQYGCHKFYK